MLDYKYYDPYGRHYAIVTEPWFFLFEAATLQADSGMLGSGCLLYTGSCEQCENACEGHFIPCV